MMFSQNELKMIAKVSSEKITDVREGREFFEVPFKHLVIDNFFPKEVADLCIENFPVLSDDSWDYTHNDDIEVKYRTKWQSEFDIPIGIVDVVRVMNSSLFLKAMTVAFGIPKIIPDPYFSGGGLNATSRSGLLDVHVDGNYHDATGLNRRINALLYLNPNWEEGWGGEFGLFDGDGDNCLKKIAPLHNRLVIFETHDKSFHGLPDPINFPEHDPRKSIIMYYYTKDSRPSEVVSVKAPHSALWKKQGFLDKLGNQTRDFD